MTMAQLLEALLGKAAAAAGAVGNATTFMNEGSPAAAIGKVLQEQFGMQPMGERTSSRWPVRHHDSIYYFHGQRLHNASEAHDRG
jgi:hypothetical protein